MTRLDRRNVEDILSLAPVQAGMLFHHLDETGAGSYFVQLSLNVRGRVAPDTFKAAWAAVAAANEMLRATFRWEKTAAPVQVILKEAPPDIRYYDFSGRAVRSAERELNALKEADRAEQFDLSLLPFRVTLCKLAERSFEVLISYHHILFDGWSAALVVREFLSAYNRLSEGEPPCFDVKPGFKEFIKRRLASERSAAEAFWKEYLSGQTFDSTLSLEPPQLKPSRLSSNRLTLKVPGEVTKMLRRFAIEQRVTSSAIFYAAWAVLLARYTNNDDVVFGTTVSGRNEPIAGIEKAVGLFINTPPLRVQLKPEESVLYLVRAVHRLLLERCEFELTPLAEIQRLGGIKPGRRELFNNIFVVENYPIDVRNEPGKALSLEGCQVWETTHYDLTVALKHFDEMELDFIYREDRFAESAVRRLGDHFINLLSQCVQRPESNLYQLEMLTDRDRQQLLVEFNSTAAAYPDDMTLVDIFEERALFAPDTVAVFDENVQVTYRELKERSDRLSSYLRAHGTVTGSVVGLLVERSISMMVGLLAILKAGAAYLPLSADYPPSRLEFMLRDSRAELLLTQSGLGHELSYAGERVNLDDPAVYEPPKSQAMQAACRPDDAAYVIYTSGSTGVPKAVVIEHRSVVNRINWMQQTYRLTGGDVIMQKTPLSFDVSVWELFLGWLSGARLYLLPHGDEKDPSILINHIERARVTIIHFVPSMLRAFLESAESLAASRSLESLRLVFSSGEPLRGNLVKRFWSSMREQEQIRLVNLYGPTEATVDVSSYECTETDTEWDIVPIGRPISNTRFYIVGHWGQLQPIGSWGELNISGVCLARGYLNRPELTDERFPEETVMPGVRLYRTGDIARWLPDGNLEFRGRLDDQVKLRGHRVELGEIESHLLTFEGIKAAVAMVRAGGANEEDAILLAYYVSDTPCEASALRAHLLGRLPTSMVPSFFIRLERLTLNANGKVDRKALPEIAAPVASDFKPVNGEVEEALAAIWSETLCIDKRLINASDNFLALGGNSLSAVRLMTAIGRKLQVKLPLVTILRQPTLRELAVAISHQRRSALPDIPRVEERDYYELSYSQKRLWLFHQLHPEDTSYNLVGRIELRGPLDSNVVAGAINCLVKRHDSLRTFFGTVKASPVQVVAKTATARLNMKDFSIMQEAERERARDRILSGEAAMPFDLNRAPLLRTTLVKLAEDRYDLVVSMPHIIVDGWSVEILKDEFRHLLSAGAEALPPLPVQYKDFVAWENCRLKDKSETAASHRFWRSLLSSPPPVLNLPYDYPPGSASRTRSEASRLMLSSRLTRCIRRWACEQRTSLFMPLLTAFQLMLAQVTRQDEVMLAIAASARQHDALQGVVGMFVNTLILRARVNEEQSLLEFFRSTESHVWQALEHQAYPLELVCEELRIARPHIPVFLNMLNVSGRERTAEPDPAAFRLMQEQESKFDLACYLTEYADAIEVNCHYKNRFHRRTIEKLLGLYAETLESLCVNHQQSIASLYSSSTSRVLRRQTACAVFS